MVRVVAIREDDIFYSVSIYIQPDRLVTFSMEDRDATEFALVLAGYYKLLTGELKVVKNDQMWRRPDYEFEIYYFERKIKSVQYKTPFQY